MGSSQDTQETHVLTKSTFLRGLRCGKSLMLNALHDELSGPLDADSLMRMGQGQEVGMLARKRYPGGQIGRIPGQIFILVDILVKGNAGWQLIEVKSTTKADKDHLWDVAVQAFVLRGTGLALQDASLLHMNREYFRQGELDLQMLFSEAPLLDQVLDIEAEVTQSVTGSKSLLALGEVPERDIGVHCVKPNTCDFKEHCWQHLPSPSVFDVYYIGKKAFNLYGEGITRIEDIPEDFSLDRRSHFHIGAHKAGETIIEREKLLTYIDSLEYPLYYLDFETIALPIPAWDGLRPYNQVPFQYSLHVQNEPGGEAVHSGYLARAGVDPRREFLESLLPETEGTGSIVVYYKSFERGVLASLGEQFPEYRTAIDQRIERLVDLRDPFSKRLFFVPAMGGSTSLKAVLPALVPDLSYDVLEVQNGTQAMAVFLALADQGDSDVREARRIELWEYCKLDTWAMVRILDVLREQRAV